MELFTLGVDQYTQDDVVASARAWTGHNTLDGDRTQYHFYPNRHDNGLKTFMGVTQNWDGPDIINFILRDDADAQGRSRPGSSPRRCGRSSRTRIPTTASSPTSPTRSSPPTSRSPSSCARSSTTRRFSRRPRSRDSCARPVEWVVACMRAVGMTAADANPQWWMADMGQQLFEPPNVSGWRPNEYWLTTSRLWARANWTRYIIWQEHANNVGDTLSGIVGMSVANAVQHAFDVLGIDSPSSHTRGQLGGVAHRATRRPQRVDELVVHQPADARDAEPGDEPCLTQTVFERESLSRRRFLQGSALTAGVVAVEPVPLEARGVRGAAGRRQPGHPRSRSS